MRCYHVIGGDIPVTGTQAGSRYSLAEDLREQQALETLDRGEAALRLGQ